MNHNIELKELKVNLLNNNKSTSSSLTSKLSKFNTNSKRLIVKNPLKAGEEREADEDSKRLFDHELSNPTEETLFKQGIGQKNWLSSTASSSASSSCSSIVLETNLIESNNQTTTTQAVTKKTAQVLKRLSNSNRLVRQNRRDLLDNKHNIISNQSSEKMCCTKRFNCTLFILMYLCSDLTLNLLFVTNLLKRLPSFDGFDVRSSLIDVWIISLLRDVILLTILFLFVIKHNFIFSFIKWVHNHYLSAFLCLMQYSFVMIKMLLHADQREPDRSTMIFLIWNIAASILFFISWYAMALIKPKECNYSKTDVDGGDLGENAHEEDIFIETLKETQKKRSSLFRLFKYSKKDIHYILIGTFFLLVGSICEAFVPYYTGQVLDSIIVKKDFTDFKKNAILFIGAHFIAGMFGGLRTCAFSVAVSRLNVRLRKLVFTALIEQDIGFFDKIKTGDMLSRLSADTTTMSDLISQNLNGFLWNFVKTLGTLVFIMKLSWQLSLTCLIGAPIIFSVGKLFGNYYRKLSTKVQKAMAEANHVAEEALSTIRTVRSFANEDGEINSYLFKLKEMLKHKIRQAFVFTTYDWSVKISELCMTMTMLSYGAHLVSTQQISSGDFISFVIYQLTLAACLEGLTSVYTGLMSAAGASEKIFEYLDIKPELQITRAYEPDNVRGAIEFRNVSFSYPTRPDAPVLKNISLSVRPGEVIALVGPSGSGKSSCVSLLERFYKPDKGEILIDGLPLSDFNHKFIHRVIALVGQEPVLYARSISKNISYGLDEDDYSLEKVMDAAKMANAHGFIMETPKQYETECGERGTQLSGGQKQRIAIARALIRNPTILLLDEATSALDAESEYLVQQAIHKNLKGHTVIVVAHRLSTIENADKIVVLDHGEIVEMGNHRELLKQNGLYAHLVHKQMHGDQSADNDSIKSGPSTPSLTQQQIQNIQKRFSNSNL